jgi:tRNA threonylcarbamoyladenosine biosynthesis protein TsaB
MEVYTRTFTENSSLRSEIEPLIVDENTSSLFSQYSSICFIGDGALKCEEFLGGEGRVFLEEYPCVESSIPLGHTAFISGNFVNLSSYEPNYLKAFQAGAAKDPFGLRKKLSL